MSIGRMVNRQGLLVGALSEAKGLCVTAEVVPSAQS